jgi:hypothetical protein
MAFEELKVEDIRRLRAQVDPERGSDEDLALALGELCARAMTTPESLRVSAEAIKELQNATTAAMELMHRHVQ